MTFEKNVSELINKLTSKNL